ncbi:hypothetical protein C0989_004986 [Termitomyces sp. Mn162]|nr:hypothetical protein C0989_004986 [Termitomyces sp. Mn162]
MELVRKLIKKNFIVLIDEYDDPQQHAFEKGFIDEAEDIMKTFYTTLLKDNPTSQEGTLCTLTRQSPYRDLFGFTSQPGNHPKAIILKLKYLHAGATPEAISAKIKAFNRL